MTFVADLIGAYTTYRVEKAKIRAQQRVELELRLTPYAEAVGREMELERFENGLRIEDLLVLIGTKNRATAYSFINAWRKSRQPEIPAVQAEPEAAEYSIRYDYMNALAQVTIGDSTSQVVLDGDGQVAIMPEAWIATDERAKRALYRKIIQEINSHGDEG